MVTMKINILKSKNKCLSMQVIRLSNILIYERISNSFLKSAIKNIDNELSLLLLSSNTSERLRRIKSLKSYVNKLKEDK